VAPFATFVGIMAVEKILAIPSGRLYALRAAVTLAVLLAFSRRVTSWIPQRTLASIALGVAVFAIWVAPDVLWPGYRTHWLFSNSLMGEPGSTLPDELKSRTGFLVVRVLGSAGLVPIVEELFWRGWLMRWLISPVFQTVPLGAYTPFSFWMTAALFASEHGPYWDVGLVTGIIYNWWMAKTRSLADCILAHAVTNGCLAAYVLGWNQWQYWL
jgi:CAAX prenyl protease-like protein